MKNKFWFNFFDLIFNFIVIGALVLVFQTWVVAPFDVTGASMCDTLNHINGQCTNGKGEKILINTFGYLIDEPKRGDIIVFKVGQDAETTNIFSGKYYIKRVIGLPGETVEIKSGRVYVTPINNGEKFELIENYLNEENKNNTRVFFSDYNSFKVPEDQYFVMGDNRKASTDSRSCFSSTISEECTRTPEKSYVKTEHIRGKAWLAWWPLQDFRILH